MRNDLAVGRDAASVHAELLAEDQLRWRVRLRIDKYDPDQTAFCARKSGLHAPQARHFEGFGIKPAEVLHVPDNLLLTAGLNRLTSLLIGAGGQAMTNTATRFGAGNSATAEAIGQTDLQAAAGSANRWFQIMDATYPQQSNGVVTVKSTFASADGNFTWSEWGVDIGTPTVTSGNTVAANLFNRKVQVMGTKASGATWVPTATITIS